MTWESRTSTYKEFMAFGQMVGSGPPLFRTRQLQLSILGFLGYGAPPPTPEWGLIIAEGRDFMATAWWLIILPGIALVAVVMSANRLSQNFPVEA